MKALEAQQHRRFLKTHLGLDALEYQPQVKYIYMRKCAICAVRSRLLPPFPWIRSNGSPEP